MGTSIEVESPGSPAARRVIAELEAELDPLYPDESQHGYSVDKLISEGVAFFLVRYGGEEVGCGGIQLFGSEYGELKRMYIRPPYRGLGLGRQLIDRLIEHARLHGVSVLRLETGIHQDEAIRLYERMGFRQIPPFPPYQPDPLSLFYQLVL
ncbi:MAG TPA: GNAT family N-acetyltransferase [Acidimicrobiia bacterium]|nr:GNAT family N-acetyltransferase [Acidimicrobiia bacterium]